MRVKSTIKRTTPTNNSFHKNHSPKENCFLIIVASINITNFPLKKLYTYPCLTLGSKYATTRLASPRPSQTRFPSVIFTPVTLCQTLYHDYKFLPVIRKRGGSVAFSSAFPAEFPERLVKEKKNFLAREQA